MNRVWSGRCRRGPLLAHSAREWHSDLWSVPADELRLSRSRAVAVQHYVQQRLEIDPKNLGVVPMKSAPPRELGRATWDGVCIVVLLGS